MSLADYIAKKYLTAEDPKAEKKSKKRKRKAGEDGFTVKQDNLTGWEDTTGVESDNLYKLPTGNRATDAKPTTKWTVFGAAAPSNSAQAEADAVIAAAVEEDQKQRQDDEDVPVIEDVEGLADSRSLVGLRSGDEVAAHLAKKREDELARYRKEETAADGNQDTVYRDAAGRVINMAKKRAEEQRAAQEKLRRAKADLESAKGDAQRRMKEERAQDLREAKYLSVARHADDADMNSELKAQERWNDPALGFLSKKKAEGKTLSGRPAYQGSFEPNRYKVHPGARWDGVDRGNGFERKWFAARNRQRDRAGLEYAWQMDE